MTNQGQDPEQVIRDWLSDSADLRAPASLRASLERVLSGPPARTGLPRRTLSLSNVARSFVRLAAAIAMVAVIGGLVLLRSGSSGISSPSASTGVGVSASPVASVSATARATASGLARTPEVTRVAGSGWTLVDGALPQLLPVDQWLTAPCPIFARAGGGFVAFVSTARLGYAAGRNMMAALAPSTAPTPAGSRETEVFTSPDGVNWTMASTLPTPDATVADVAEAGGVLVAVGWAGQEPPIGGAAEIWTSRDLRTWSATDVSRADGAPAENIVYGPAGFLVWGVGNSEAFPYDFWISKDGSNWQPLTASGLPNDKGLFIGAIDILPGGYTIYDHNTATVWQSADAEHWARAWAYTGPGASPKREGDPYVALGPVFAARSGGFVSFGQSGTVSGGPTPGPEHILTWTSSDGIQWSPGKANSFGVNLAFAAGPDGFIAAGAQPAADDTSGTPWGKLAAWRTSDGGTWTTVADLPTVGATDVSSAVEVLGAVTDGTHIVIVCLDASGSTPETGDLRSGNLLLVVGQ